MGRRRRRPKPLFIPPTPQDFVPVNPPADTCLICDEWLGIGPEEHDHDVKKDGSHHESKNGISPHTPHLIFSPTLEPNYHSSDEETEENKENEGEVEGDSEAVTEEAKQAESPSVSEPLVCDTAEKALADSPDANPAAEKKTATTVRRFNLRKFKFPSDIDISSTHSSSGADDTPIVYPTDREETVINMEQTVRSDNVRQTHVLKNEMSGESLIVCLSALYGKLLVVMGMAFPVAEIISEDVPLHFYYSFYLYLYVGSVLFLMYAYLFLLRTKSFPDIGFKRRLQTIKRSVSNLDVKVPEIPMKDTLKQLLPTRKQNNGLVPGDYKDKADGVSVTTSTYKPPKYTITNSSNHGSMYLKMGAVVFGIGSMVYSGLAFGQYFELRRDAECGNVLMAITPMTKMIFTFLQMYFIFLNSRVAISKHTIIARFGFMHMIGTNLCIWLNVLVQETQHEITHLTHYEASKNQVHGTLHGGGEVDSDESWSVEDHDIVTRSLGEMYDLSHCREVNLMGNIVTSASPFLFPCTIEYSLLCAGVLYVMWKNINITRAEKSSADGDSDISHFIARKVRHHYSVDCARASRGLFLGIFVLVLTIISLILFYVLITNEDFRDVAILEANITEVTIYSMAIIAVLIGMRQMRELEFIPEGDIELDNILLLIAQAGVYIYASFTIIGGCFSLEEDSPRLPLITAMLTLAQTTLQTIFILDGSRRCCYTADQHDRKPGREMVTFLLVCNLAMWAISTFETSRADVHPVQLHFYGIWAWTIISHVSMPLAIFYRFHVTVCLGEIWKRSYKMKNDFISL